MYLKVLFLLLLTTILPIILAHTYELVQYLTNFSGWLAAASINTLIALWISYFFKNKLFRANKPAKLSIFGRHLPLWVAYLPALVVLLVALVLPLISGLQGKRQAMGLGWEFICFIIWIPIVEELVFRVGIGRLYRNIGGSLWGAYFSAVTFAFVHSIPTVGRIAAGDIGVLPTHFALGLVCEWLYIKTNRVSVNIAFHIACNSVGPLFMLLDSRWLSWLGFLFN